MKDQGTHSEQAHHAIGAPQRQPSRRAFLTSVASACAAAALWSAHTRGFAAVLPAAGGDLPATVTIIDFAPNGKQTGRKVVPRVVKSDAEWQQQLSPISYQVARRAGTERPFTGNSWEEHGHGLFRCICCDIALFRSETKFDSGTGWPSFWQPIAQENVVETKDRSFGETRTAVSCRECDAHLGHVFDDGPRPTGLRYCMNSASLRFVALA